MRRVLGDRLRSVPARAACDVRNPLLGERGAARAFGAQKGADAAAVDELERRLSAMTELAPFRAVRGAGAGGGLGAAFAALGAELVEGSELVLDLIGFDDLARDADLVITGEGTVDATTFEGKAPGRRARAAAAGSACAASCSAASSRRASTPTRFPATPLAPPTTSQRSAKS